MRKIKIFDIGVSEIPSVCCINKKAAIEPKFFFLLSKQTPALFKTTAIAIPYHDQRMHSIKLMVPIIAQKRIPNLPIPSLLCVLFHLHLMSVSRFLFQTREIGKPVIWG